MAHFDYYNKCFGSPNYTVRGEKGVVLIAKNRVNSKMNNTDTTVGGYKSTLVHATLCPAIGTALQTVLGSYLSNICKSITTTMNANTATRAGTGTTGSSSAAEYANMLVTIPHEHQVYGFTVYSSSAYDSQAMPEKLALFNFINHLDIFDSDGWLQDIASSHNFCVVSPAGVAFSNGADTSYGIYPLIYIG